MFPVRIVYGQTNRHSCPKLTPVFCDEMTNKQTPPHETIAALNQFLCSTVMK